MITLIIGTNRPESNTAKTAHAVRAMYESIGQQVTVLDLAELPVELFAPTAYAEKPESFKPFADAVLNADGLHVFVPEYNGSFPGVLKYFIDMLPFPESFEARPVAFTGVAAGMFGALRPVEQLQQVFGYRNAYIFPSRVFVMNVYASFDAHGTLSDEKLRERLEGQAEGFAEFIASLAK
ncbi:NADPH-dependent FMN reductase [Coraliomargarita akajimensis]|nr:NADPH-dependent FMN reductase [Coraliomargarita akajimensis]